MAQSMLMKKGLEGIFSPEKKFEAEAKFGKNILIVAWCVEILAATIGLTIALATAYDAFSGISNPNLSHYINALIGALPFLVIAVIEPTKIPLAGGFYKTRILGWKILILLALIGLTIVTFETMFNGLERNLTNVTRQVVVSDNKIQFLGDRLEEKERELNDLTSKSTSEIVAGIQNELDKLQQSYISDIESIQTNYSSQIDDQRKIKSNLEDRKSSTAELGTTQSNNQIDGIKGNITSLENQIAELEKRKQTAIANYQNQIQNIQQQNADSARQGLELITSQVNSKKQEIEKLKEDNVRDIEIYRGLLKDEDRIYRDKLDALETGLKTQLDGVTQFIGKTAKQNELREAAEVRRKSLERDSKAKRSQIEADEADRKASFDTNLETLKEELKTLENRLNSASSSAANSTTSLDDEELNKIRQRFDSQINPLRENIGKFQRDIADIISSQSGTTKRELTKINSQIDRADKKIEELNDELQERISEKTQIFEKRKSQLETQKAERVNQIEALKNNDEQIEKEILQINREIDEAKKVKRDASYDSQVYRLAALAFGKSDVADVTKDEIKIVSVVWFGSIAFIVSTIGTVLALISYILRDPEAFVDRPKLNFSRRVYVLLRLFFKQSFRLIAAILNAILAFTKLILSFAEIFRGLVGVPIQRSIRRLFVAIRKRLNRPRIVEIEKEVEKIVEKEVEKIVEVEKEIEKIVEVEKVVEKVVTTEVPVEIIRKELVYVPLYSTESGLIDASTELKGAKPKLNEESGNSPTGRKGEAKTSKNKRKDDNN